MQTETAYPATVSVTTKLNGQDIINLLAQSGIVVSSDATCHFNVPWGGDYSGVELEVTDENYVVIRYTKFIAEADSCTIQN